MTSLRARAFVKNGMCCPLDLVRAGVDRIASVLYDQLPFTDDAPLRVGKTHGVKAGRGVGLGARAGAGAGVDCRAGQDSGSGSQTGDIRARQRDACRLLAVKIVKRAHYMLAEEVTLLNSR